MRLVFAPTAASREKARLVGARSDGPENSLRPRPIPRRQRPGRWIAGVCLRPSASVIATRASSARTRESRSSSCGQSIDIQVGLRPERRLLAQSRRRPNFGVGLAPKIGPRVAHLIIPSARESTVDVTMRPSIAKCVPDPSLPNAESGPRLAQIHAIRSK